MNLSSKLHLSPVECIRDKQAFFASQLCNAMKGLGTKDSKFQGLISTWSFKSSLFVSSSSACLIRIIVSRSEVDMVQIKQKFEALYKKSLADWIKVSRAQVTCSSIQLRHCSIRSFCQLRATHLAIT